MIAVDTNVLARFVLQDDALQTRRAAALMGEIFWVADTVWVELGWVLSRQRDRSSTADALAAVLALRTLRTNDPAGIAWAIDRFRLGADWADMLHLVTARSGATFATFDRDLARRAGSETPLAIELLA